MRDLLREATRPRPRSSPLLLLRPRNTVCTSASSGDARLVRSEDPSEELIDDANLPVLSLPPSPSSVGGLTMSMDTLRGYDTGERPMLEARAMGYAVDDR